ncbi:MAG: FAD-dependent oxidoreductase [Leptolyngbyaceae bacterium]|nr:FAD-dependent oxidoreductase [Leptolyngbyaceae bacterium]
MFDVVVVGAGFAGLSCARELQAYGYSVAVFEKSRGLGGRAATRRVDQHCFNYGARYFSATGAATQALLDELTDDSNCETPELVSWPRVRITIGADGALTPQSVSEGYVPRTGMTAIAKYLAQDLDITRQYRVQALCPGQDGSWDIYVESQADFVARTRAVVLAIPAPQAQLLLTPLKDLGLPHDFFNAVQSVEFDPCFTVITGYSSEQVIAPSTTGKPIIGNSMISGQADELCFSQDSEIQWVGVVRANPVCTQSDHESTETETDNSTQPLILVTQSSPSFAQEHIETENRQSVGQKLLLLLSHQLQSSQISHPNWMQVHLWRYALCRQPITSPFLVAETPGIIGCSGDWCGGHQIDHAIASGISLSRALREHLG